MRISFIGMLTALLVSTLSPSAGAAQEPQVSAQARSIFDHNRDSVAQIRVLLGRSDSHTATGSGFLIRTGGLMLTNYHVVADKALEPQTYRLELVLPSGRRSALRILALDVVHDLAVVQGDVGDARPLSFVETELSKGDKVFSLGYPLGQGLTVTEGTYNGRSEEQYYEHFHFTGALNPGMSGGPAVDASGKVLGINVASHLGGQLVSFLVPAKYAKDLLDKAAGAGPGERDFRKEVGAQLRAHGEDLMGSLLKEPMALEKVSDFTLPGKVGEFMQCGAATSRESERSYTVDSYRCQTLSSLYIDPRLHTGMISFQHSILRSTQLGALRFANLQESRFAAGRGGEFDRRHHTRYACDDRVVALKGKRAKMVMCVRGYKRFEGLYDVVVKIATLGNSERALQSQLNIEGVSYEAAMTFARR
ncbi:MAG: S1C family serine protease, partial [Burkholderiales bacterium]